jgi:hypothetical protein
LNGARWDAEVIFEIAGEMGELFVSEVVGDAFDAFAVFEAGIGEVQAQFAKEFGDGDLIMFDEVAFESAEGNAAMAGEDGGAEARSAGEGFPGGMLPRWRGDGRWRCVVGGDVSDTGCESDRGTI